MNEFNNGLAKLQIDLINLVQVTSIQKLPEQYEKLKKISWQNGKIDLRQ
ncbi:Uncharacterised protein [Legionella hackeliae]|nr:Uncharacterised protein [Legionella hackeliae]